MGLKVDILQGDCVEVMAAMLECSVDAVVCDPPYGLEFMGKEWDALDNDPVSASWSTKGRTMTGSPKKGAVHLIVRDNPRCTKCGRVRDGRDTAKGFKVCHCDNPVFYAPSTRARKAQAWHERWAREAYRVLRPGGHLLAFGGSRTYHRMACAVEDAGFEIRDQMQWIFGSGFPKSHNLKGDWHGWGTALKPAHEPIVVARKPLIGTVAANVEKHGTGAINVDGCRVDASDGKSARWGHSQKVSPSNIFGPRPMHAEPDGKGRWPANVILDEEAGKMLDGQSGKSQSKIGKPRSSTKPGDGYGMTHTGAEYTDTGGASRFFYCPKASRKEREKGLDGIEIVTVSCDAWDDAGRKARLWVDTATSPPRVTGVFGAANNDVSAWSMWLSGNLLTVLSQLDTASTTVTATDSTTNSPTLRWLASSITNAFTVGANSDKGNGGSRAESAGRSTPHLTITSSSPLVSPPGADAATFETPWRISGNVGSAASHPTCKPVALMRYLIRLVTPPGGVVLDPFLGSGTTALACIEEGFDCIGIEREEEYIEIAKARVKHWQEKPAQLRLGDGEGYIADSGR